MHESHTVGTEQLFAECANSYASLSAPLPTGHSLGPSLPLWLELRVPPKCGQYPAPSMTGSNLPFPALCQSQVGASRSKGPNRDSDPSPTTPLSPMWPLSHIMGSHGCNICLNQTKFRERKDSLRPCSPRARTPDLLTLEKDALACCSACRGHS